MSASPLPAITCDEPSAVAIAKPTLTPVLSIRQALGLHHLLLTGLFGGLFMAASYVGLRPTDLWCHVAYGQWMFSHGVLPTTDPFLANAEGMPVLDGAWLSQVLLAQIYTMGGGELLSALFAVVVLLSYLLLFYAVLMRTKSLPISAGAVIVALAVAWSRLWTIRPEMFGTLCFSFLLWLLAYTESHQSQTARRALTWGAAPLFMLWANLHGSFVCGLAVIYCYLLGTVIRIGWCSRDWRVVLASPTVRGWLLTAELATLGALINPYGMDLLVWTVGFARNPNLKDVLEWQPLSFSGVGGTGFALSIALLLFVWRHSRRRVTATEILLIALFGLATMSGVRMIGWYAATLVYVLAPHVANIVARWRGSKYGATAKDERSRSTTAEVVPTARSFRYTLACLLLAWICFALSPASQRLLGATRSAKQLFQEDTPLELTTYLRKHPPQGRIFNPQHWGDWILVDGPSQEPIFVTTMIHNLPPRVWQDYRQISMAGSGWERLLQKYNIDVAILDKKHQPALAALIKRSPNWQVQYEDDRAVVAKWHVARTKPSDE